MSDDTQKDLQTLLQQTVDAANQNFELNNFEGAFKLFQNALSLDPTNHKLMFMCAMSAAAGGNPVVSEQFVKKAIQTNDQMWEYHVHLGNILHQQGRHPRAEKSYSKALSIKEDLPDALFGIANAKFRSNKEDEAISYLEKLIALSPDHPNAKKMLGSLLFLKGKITEGRDLLIDAVKLNADDLEALGNLGSIYAMTGMFDEAVDTLRTYVEKKPDGADKYCELANALQCLGRVDEAMAAVETGLKNAPNHPQLIDQRGIMLLAQNDTDRAITDFKSILSETPDNPSVRAHMGMAMLAAGDYENGWVEYDERLKDPNYPAEERNFPRPIWDGSEQKDATLLLYTEQGAGDAIQFARFVKLAKSKVAHIILACRPGLEDLFENLEGVDTLITEGDVPNFDLHLPLMSLPKVLSITLDSLPADVPYLSADESKTSDWAKKLAPYKGLKVGMVSSGSPAQKVNPLRTIDPAMISQLAKVEGATIFSLQKTPEGFDAPTYSADIVDLSKDLNSYSDTMAAIANLDVVVSVCTSVAHLAGAMGKPTLVMLSKSADWRWLIDREDSPWYPTAKLLRQSEQNDWAQVIENVKAELASMT